MAMRVQIIILAVLFSLSTLTAKAADKDNTLTQLLLDYAKELYREGNTLDAVDQLKRALMINPGNMEVRRFLDKILGIKPAQERTPRVIEKEKVITRIVEKPVPVKDVQVVEKVVEKKVPVPVPSPQDDTLKKENISYKEQVQSLKKEASGQEGRLAELEKELNFQKELLLKKDELQRAYLLDKETQIAKLKGKLGDLKKENVVYEKEVETIKQESSRRSKEKDFKPLISNCEARLKSIDDEIKSREAQIDELSGFKESFLQEYAKMRQQQVSKIEQLMREIEEVLPEVRKANYAQEPLPESGDSTNEEQVARIDGLMREIEEVLPEVREPKYLENLEPDASSVDSEEISSNETLPQEGEEALPEVCEPYYAQNPPPQPFVKQKALRGDGVTKDIDKIRQPQRVRE